MGSLLPFHKADTSFFQEEVAQQITDCQKEEHESRQGSWKGEGGKDEHGLEEEKQEEPFKGQEEPLPHDAGKEESVANQGKEVKKGPNSTHGFGLDSMLKCNVPSFVNC